MLGRDGRGVHQFDHGVTVNATQQILPAPGAGLQIVVFTVSVGQKPPNVSPAAPPPIWLGFAPLGTVAEVWACAVNLGEPFGAEDPYGLFWLRGNTGLEFHRVGGAVSTSCFWNITYEIRTQEP